MAFSSRFNVDPTPTKEQERISMKEQLIQQIKEQGVNIHELRRQGYKVHITHKRENHDYSRLLTRREYETIYNILNPEKDSKLWPYPWAKVVDEKGGKTIVEITKEGETSLSAAAVCSGSDNYNHKYGVKAAFYRALGLPIPHEEKPTRDKSDKFLDKILITPITGMEKEQYCKYLANTTFAGKYPYQAFQKRVDRLIANGDILAQGEKLYHKNEERGNQH